MEYSEFEVLVQNAIAALPERFRQKLENVAFVIEPSARPGRPSETPIRRGTILLGLYQGVPYGHRGPSYSGALPDKITLFQAAIELVAGNDPVKIEEIVRNTVEHEVAHYFGMNEAQVRRWEKGRQQ